LLTFGALGVAVGAMLASRFSVFVLPPVTTLAALALVIVRLVAGHHLLHTLVMAAAIAFGIQMGYFLGVLAGIGSRKPKQSTIVGAIARQ
jgi:heme/copper-type cytochrome/quinol oxidase subunit 4